MDSKQYIIQIFLEDGLARGLRSVIIENWNGEAVVCPRKNIGDLFRDRKEIRNKVALYFLIGDSEDGLNSVYIGEADGIRSRLRNHLSKDWWREVIIFFSQSDRLTKAHVKYLESRCISMTKKAGKCNLENSNNPSKSSLPRTDISVMSNFYSKISLVLPLLGYDILEVAKDIKSSKADKEKKEIHVFCKGRGAKAEGIYTNEGKIQVLKGSRAVKNVAPAFHDHNYRRLRDFLIRGKRMIDKGKYYEFTEDRLFSSPSAAAAVILGRSASGPREWKNSKGKSIKELEEKL